MGVATFVSSVLFGRLSRRKICAVFCFFWIIFVVCKKFVRGSHLLSYFLFRISKIRLLIDRMCFWVLSLMEYWFMSASIFRWLTFILEIKILWSFIWDLGTPTEMLDLDFMFHMACRDSGEFLLVGFSQERCFNFLDPSYELRNFEKSSHLLPMFTSVSLFFMIPTLWITRRKIADVVLRSMRTSNIINYVRVGAHLCEYVIGYVNMRVQG